MADDHRWPSAPILAAVTIAVLAALTAAVFDAGRAILVIAGGALVAVIGVLWTSVRTFAGDAPFTVDEALALGAPSATEEQKRAVLQALKDLEYERSVGKVGDDDYHELLARYRADAKRLLRAADEELGPLRIKAEALVVSQASAAALEPVAGSRACANCNTVNDLDASFCKKCGAALDHRASQTKAETAEGSQDA